MKNIWKNRNKIWEKFTGSYKPPVKISTPSIKKKDKKDLASTISASTKNPKLSNSKVTMIRAKNSRDSSITMNAKKLKKMQSQKVGLISDDTHTSSLDHFVAKFNVVEENLKLPATSK